jgi:hypothetical protein
MFKNYVADKQLKRDMCKSVFKTKRTLKRRIQSLHEGKKPFKCKICDTPTVTWYQSMKEKGAFHCNICDAIFA